MSAVLSIHKQRVSALPLLAILLLLLLCMLTACAMGGPRVYQINLSFDFFPPAVTWTTWFCIKNFW